MLAPTSLYWEIYPDSELEYPRCGWSYNQWVKFMEETFIPPTKRLWQWASDSNKVKTQMHDDTDQDKIFRFATMTPEYCVKLRSFALSKGLNITITGHEIWESLAIARKATDECKQWKSGSKTKVLTRVCYIVGKWNRHSVNSTVNNYINKYLNQYYDSEEKDFYSSLPSTMIGVDHIYDTDISQIEAENVSIDEWNNIAWNPQRGNKLIISDLAIFVSLKMKLGVIRRCPLMSFDNASPKDASVKLYASTAMDTLFTPDEFSKVLNHNKENNISIQAIDQSYEQMTKYVCKYNFRLL